MLFLLVGNAAGEGRRDGVRPRGPQQMSPDERQRLREEMRELYRERSSRRPERERAMSREERDKLRRDIEDANREMRRR